jgi:hypothetical protein
MRWEGQGGSRKRGMKGHGATTPSEIPLLATSSRLLLVRRQRVRLNLGLGVRERVLIRPGHARAHLLGRQATLPRLVLAVQAVELVADLGVIEFGKLERDVDVAAVFGVPFRKDQVDLLERAAGRLRIAGAVKQGVSESWNWYRVTACE